MDHTKGSRLGCASGCVSDSGVAVHSVCVGLRKLEITHDVMFKVEAETDGSAAKRDNNTCVFFIGSVFCLFYLMRFAFLTIPMSTNGLSYLLDT